MINHVLTGAIGMGFLIAALFFLRYWKSTKDRFFLYFAVSFFIQGINRLMFLHGGNVTDESSIAYFFRFIAYALILVAVLEKNWRGRDNKSQP